MTEHNFPVLPPDDQDAVVIAACTAFLNSNPFAGESDCVKRLHEVYTIDDEMAFDYSRRAIQETLSGYQHGLEFKDVAPAFPIALKKLNRWIVRTVDKRPFSAFEDDEELGPIDPHDVQYQSSYDNALGALEQTAKFSGLGFVFVREDGLTGIDFDNCVDPNTREIRPDVLAILKQLDTYAEFSPSGEGVHAIITGWQFPIGPTGQQGGNVGKAEMYSGRRYFTVTGDQVGGTPSTVNERDAQWLYDLIIKQRAFSTVSNVHAQGSTGSDSKCRATRKSTSTCICTKFYTLMHGEITQSKDTTGSNPFCIEDADQRLEYDSQSEADFALLRLIIQEGIRDPEAIEAEFLTSPLGQRQKAQREDYLARSIKKLLLDQPAATVQNVQTELDDQNGIQIDRPKLLTEVGNARRLIEAHGKNIRYCYDLNSWFVFNGKLWQPDRNSVHLQDLMKRMLIQMQQEASQTIQKIQGLDGILGKLAKSGQPRRGEELTTQESIVLQNYREAHPLLDWARASETNQKIRGAVEQARSEPGISVDKAEFDSNKMLCNLQNGTLVFDPDGTVQFRKHLRGDLCTRLMPVDYQPDADCPQFKSFIEWMFPDQDVMNYVLTYLSLCLTGLVPRAFLILYGEGANGKSTLMKTMFSLFGSGKSEVGSSVAFSTFSIGREESAGGCRADLIPLDGPRFVVASESNKGGTVKLDMARIKEITGGDQTVARGLYSPEPKTFYAQCKIILQTNNLPQISDDSEGAWERLKLVRCGQYRLDGTRDEHLSDKLAKEGPGILNLLIGYLQRYLKQGFPGCQSIQAATEAFRGAENHIQRFVDECAELNEAARVGSSEFYIQYQNWCTRSGEEPEPQKAVVQYLERRLKVKARHKREGNLLFGIRLNQIEVSDQATRRAICLDAGEPGEDCTGTQVGGVWTGD